MQVLGPALAIAGPIMGGIAKLKAGNQARKAAYAQAHEELVAGSAQELRLRETARKAIGEQVAGQFSNGLEGGSGSALDALAESQINAMLDVQQLRYEAQTKARSLRAEGDFRRSEGRWGLATSLVGAASSAMGMGSDWAQAKAPS